MVRMRNVSIGLAEAQCIHWSIPCSSGFDNAITLPDWKGYIPANGVIFSHIHYLIEQWFVWSDRTQDFAPQIRVAIADMRSSGIPSQSYVQQKYSATPWLKRLVSGWAWCDWDIITFAVAIRPEASPEISLIAVRHNRCIRSLYWQNSQHQGDRPILRMSVNRASTVLVVAYLIFKSLR